jgi:hypothetical protein
MQNKCESATTVTSNYVKIDFSLRLVYLIDAIQSYLLLKAKHCLNHIDVVSALDQIIFFLSRI